MTAEPSIAHHDVEEPCPEPPPVPEGVLARELSIVNRKGLHARASAKFVQTVERYQAEVTVTRCGETVGGRSIMGLLTLAAAQGTSVHVTAAGPQAEGVLDALATLLATRFGEDE
ncbi:HPr family phosphocarrier protein [Salinarimonas chemoclinalis]|uniref:HPr family phosphocarrier protein n=1 Tax=Salinarimonas chemoclinalis TaxID=3241599 RepID=UPI00355631B1